MVQTTLKNQIKIVFFADSHLGFDYALKPKSKRRRRGDDFFQNYRRIISHCKDTKPDLLIHGGDVFFRSRVHKRIVDLAYEPLLELADAGLPILIVPGNHERSQLPNSLILNHPNIFVFDEPKTYSFELNGIKIALAGFPFQRGDIRNNFKSVLASTNHQEIEADVRLLCIHQAVEGAVVGPVNYTFRYGKDTIKLRDFPFEFGAVLSGHIHRHQILTKKGGAGDKDLPVIYPGSIERTAFAEMNEDKGFLELLFSKSGLDKTEFIKLPARPMVDLCIDKAESIEALKSSITTSINGLDKNAVVRIKCDLDIAEIEQLQLNTGFFQSIFPDTMNFQFTRSFFMPSEKRTPARSEIQDRLLKRIRREVPDKIGVYMFYGNRRNILYIGKSVNLKQRMSSYFQQNSNELELRIQQIIFNINDFSFVETETELLALLLEDCLIKRHSPDYNIKQQEFNEYRYLLLTNDRFPTLKMIPHTDIQNGDGQVFGPFKDRYFVRDLLKIIYHNLNLRQCQDKEPVQKSMNYDLGFCTGPCRDKIDSTAYSEIVQKVTGFLNGDEKYLSEKLFREMQKYSTTQEFEKAAEIKNEIEFCRNFCKRQRFIHRFKTTVLESYENGEIAAFYKFTKGNLVSLKIDDKTITHNPIELDLFEKSDERFLLDRANIVYKYLNNSNISYNWI